MISNPVSLGSLRILISGTESDVLDSKKTRWMKGITIFAPASLTSTVTVKVSGDDGGSFQTLYSGGTQVEVPAGSAVAIDYVGWDALRLVSASAEAAERVFVIKGVEEVR